MLNSNYIKILYKLSKVIRKIKYIFRVIFFKLKHFMETEDRVSFKFMDFIAYGSKHLYNSKKKGSNLAILEYFYKNNRYLNA
jgi:hypothetical protein